MRNLRNPRTWGAETVRQSWQRRLKKTALTKGINTCSDHANELQPRPEQPWPSPGWSQASPCGPRRWASNAEYVDSGLHWDQNSGGFLTQVVGTKDIVLFPLMDTEFLYMRTDRGHHFESSLYMFRDLRPEHQEDHPMARRIDARPCERVCPTSLSLPSTSL